MNLKKLTIFFYIFIRLFHNFQYFSSGPSLTSCDGTDRRPLGGIQGCVGAGVGVPCLGIGSVPLLDLQMGTCSPCVQFQPQPS